MRSVFFLRFMVLAPIFHAVTLHIICDNFLIYLVIFKKLNLSFSKTKKTESRRTSPFLRYVQVDHHLKEMFSSFVIYHFKVQEKLIARVLNRRSSADSW